LRHSGAAELAGLVVVLPHWEHIGYEARSRSGRRAEGEANRTDRSNADTGATKGYVYDKTFDQMAAELKA
jgi:hypothetical protein